MIQKNYHSYVAISRMLIFITPLITICSIWLAIEHAPFFNWYDSYLSDLGVGENSRHYFNFGLILSGICAIFISIGIHQWMTSFGFCAHGAKLLLAGSISLICVGIFTEDFGSLHYIVSVAFFTLFAFSLIFIGIEERNRYKMIGIVTTLLGISVIPIWAWNWQGDGGAIPEALSVIVFFAALILQSRIMREKKSINK